MLRISVFDQQININIQEDETFTYQPWHTLFEQNQREYLACYIVGATLLDNGRVFCYDGVQLTKRLLNLRDQNLPLLDPLTNAQIAKVDYVFIKCFDLNDEIEIVKIDLNQKNIVVYNEDLDREIICNSANSFAMHSAKNIALVAKMQYIIGTQLLEKEDYKNGLPWLWCASQHGQTRAQNLFNHFSQSLKEINDLLEANI